MKKILAIILVLATLVSFASCNVLFPEEKTGDGGTKKGNKTEQSITVYVEGTPVSYTAVIGEVLTINIPNKQGYYFVGAYDREQDGTKYFDESGNSTMVWSDGNPTTFYARFDAIQNIHFTQVLREEDPYSWHSGELFFQFDLDNKLKNAVNANFEANMKVDVSFEATCEENNWDINDVYLTNLKTGGEKYYFFQTADVVSSNYTKFEKSFTVKAKLVKDGVMYFHIEAPYTVWQNVDYSIKNITLSISFES